MIIQGNLWDHLEEVQLLGFTANSTINSKGELVMGAGIAKEVLNRYPLLALEFGGVINNYKPGVASDYYVSINRNYRIYIAAIQVKRHWSDKGQDYQVALTRNSLLKLSKLVITSNLKTAINMPLIGNGGFNHLRDNIFSLVEEWLPMDLVDVYYL